MDSKLDSPETIGDEESLFLFLQKELENGEKELLIVVSQEVEQAGTWRRNSDASVNLSTSSDQHSANETATSNANLQPLDDL